MVIKVYLSGISASKELKKRQQRALFILDSLRVEYENVDITEPGHEEDRQMIKEICKKRDGAVPLPPQFFNGDQYCGDWFDFDAASDEDKVLVFLKLEEDKPQTENQEGETKKAALQLNGEKEEKSEDVNNELQSNVDSDGKLSVNTPLESANDDSKEDKQESAFDGDKEVTIKETADAELDSSINEKNEDAEVISKTKKDSDVKLNAEIDKSDEQMEDVSSNSETKDARREQMDGNESDVELNSMKEQKTDDIVDDQAYEEVETNKEVTIYEVHNSKKREANDEKDKELENEKKEDIEETGEE